MPTRPSEPEEVQAGFRIFKFHGVDDIYVSAGDDDGYADCPFCGKKKKLSINKDTTKFRCLVCDVSGNEHSFIRQVWEQSHEAIRDKDLEGFAESSGLLSSRTAYEWGVCKHVLTEELCVPGYNKEGKVTGLYVWRNMKTEAGWKRKLLPSPKLGHHLFGFNLYEPEKPRVYICEGWRDAMVLYEVLKMSSPHGVPLLDDCNVLAMPGTNSFKEDWVSLFHDKEVVLMFDNDHPQYNEKKGVEVEVGGVVGVKRTASILNSNPEYKPKRVMYLAWGGSTEGYCRDLSNKLDIREYLTQ